MTFAQAIKELALICPYTNRGLSAKALIEALKEDVILAVERPGSWEGANMLNVLRSHGFLDGQ
jgi:hypothetical protein